MRRLTIALFMMLVAGCDRSPAPTLGTTVAALHLSPNVQAESRSTVDGTPRYVATWEFAGGQHYQLEAMGDEMRPTEAILAVSMPADPSNLDVETLMQVFGNFCAEAAGEHDVAGWQTWIDGNVERAKSTPVARETGHAVTTLEFATSARVTMRVTVRAR